MPIHGYALDFQPGPREGDLYASGTVNLDDAEKVNSIVTLEYRQRHGLVRFPVKLYLNSDGGSLIGGLRLGAAARELRLHTIVAEGNGCYSACAWAFLGGVRRQVVGQYGVHASSLAPSARPVSAASALDSVQFLSAVSMGYATEMVGSSDVASMALATSAGAIKVLSDHELVKARVITDASRPSQRGVASFDCSRAQGVVEEIVCDNVGTAGLDKQIASDFKELQALAPKSATQDEHLRWLAHRDSCKNDSAINGYDGIRWCVQNAYQVRAEQLAGRMMDARAGRKPPANVGWPVIEPVCSESENPC
jgi:hypothetical protein